MPAHVIGYNERHLLPDPEAVAIFNHIPKCGGSTLNHMLATGLPECCLLGHYNIFEIRNRLVTAKAFISHDVSGIEHLLPDEINCYYFTFMRHPLARMISSISFAKYYLFSDIISNNSFEQIIYTYSPKNTLIQFLGNGNKELAAENLFEKYSFFGLVEAYTTSINALSEIIPELRRQEIVARNVSEKHKEIDSKAKDYFFETNKDDIELYEMAVKEFKKRYSVSCKAEKPEPINLQSANINKKSTSLSRFSNLYNAVLSAEEQKQPLQLTTTDLYILYNSLDDLKILYRCLMRDIDSNDAYVYYAFICASKMQLRKPMRELAERLFLLCQCIDLGNNIRVLVECRLDIVLSLLHHGLWRAADPFFVKLEDWLRLLRAQRAWRDRSLYALGTVRMAENNWSEAVPLLREAATLNPHDLDVHEALCKALLQSGPKGLATAVEDARAALSVDPGTEWALRQMAVCAVRMRERVEAVRFARLAVAKNPCYGAGWSILVHAALADDAPEQAIEYARAAVAAVPEQAEYSYLLCELLHRLGRDDEALAEIDAALRAKPERGRLHLLATEILEDQGRLEQALEHIRLAVDALPYASEPRVRLGLLLLRLGKPEEMESQARDALRGSPTEGWPFVYLALVAESRGNIGEAILNMRKACRKQPEQRSFAALYARLLRTAGHLDETEAFCWRALKKEIAQSWAWRELRRCAEERGKYESAREFGRLALKVEPDTVEF